MAANKSLGTLYATIMEEMRKAMLARRLDIYVSHVHPEDVHYETSGHMGQ